MKEIFDIAKKNIIFNEISYSDFCHIFKCLDCKVYNFEKKQILFLAGNRIDIVGIVISGSVNIIKEDSDGVVTLLTEILQGEMFGETFACAGISHSPVTVISNSNSKVLFFNFKKIVSSCKNNCIFHTRLIENMLKIIAMKNLFLNQKIEIISKRTIREKLLCFFDFERKGNKKFIINYNREELSAFIGSDRSAVCAELSRMQKAGLIKYNKNNFEIFY